MKKTIDVVNIQKTLSGRPILKGVTFDVEEGTTTSIVGVSGCGKTTLLRHIMGLLKPDSGTVYVEGEDIVNAKPARLAKIREKFGVVFQSAALLNSLTIEENVALPLREHTNLTPGEIRKIVDAKLEMVRLGGFNDYKPADVSGGMKKRAGIARAIVRNPKIILYDEPTTGLDPIISNTINNLIIDLREQLRITSVVITHDIAGAYIFSDEIVMLHSGEVIAEENPQQFQEEGNPVVRQFLEGTEEGPITSD